MHSFGKIFGICTVLVLSWALLAHNLCIPRPSGQSAPASPGAASPSGGSTPNTGGAPSSGSPSSPAGSSSGSPSAPSGSYSPASSPSSSPSGSSSGSPSAPSGSYNPTSSPSSSSSPSSGGRQGQASFYTEWNSNPGSCGFIPSDGMIAAINPSFMPASCNKCIQVNSGGKSIKVKVTDTCPSCGVNKIDLSDQAFAKLDSLSKGILEITWEFVAC